jgi:putative photosynthetic complex assembly protein
MNSARHADSMPRGPILAIAALLLVAVAAAATARLSGAPARAPDAPTVAVRSLIFSDRADGGVDVTDASTGVPVAEIQGEAGFLRGALRALARERRMRSMGGEAPLELLARADGRLTLADPATGRRIDLESFGPANAGVFSRLLDPGSGAAASR